MTGTLQFYDFDKNWKCFYEVWTSDEVQDVLESHMQNWCKHEAYYVHTHNGMEKPTWKRCDDLWRYSRTDFHSQRILDKINEHVRADRCVEKYVDAMKRFGIRFTSPELSHEAFWNVAGDHLEESFEPEPHSLEANVLFGGANFMVEALEVAAQKLFPSCDIDRIEDAESQNKIVIINEDIIFDFIRFYFKGDHTVEQLQKQFDLKSN